MLFDHIFPMMKASNILSAALGLSEGTIWPAPLITYRVSPSYCVTHASKLPLGFSTDCFGAVCFHPIRLMYYSVSTYDTCASTLPVKSRTLIPAALKPSNRPRVLASFLNVEPILSLHDSHSISGTWSCC